MDYSLRYKLFGIPANIGEFFDRERTKYKESKIRIKNYGKSKFSKRGVNDVSVELYVESADYNRKIKFKSYEGRVFFSGDAEKSRASKEELSEKVEEGKKEIRCFAEEEGFSVIEVSPLPHQLA